MSASASIAARVAGAIGALGYLTGMVDGLLIGVLGGLSLITFGRAVVSPGGSELIGPASFGVLAAAAGVPALRWGTLDLADIRGAQGVLGPTIAVEPDAVAVMCAAACVAAAIALGVWLAEPAGGAGVIARWWWVEGAAGAMLLASLFVGPPPTDPVQGVLWLGGALVVGLIATGAGRVMGARDTHVRLSLLAACGAVVGIAAAVAGGLA